MNNTPIPPRKDDLSLESAEALIKSMRKAVLDSTGLIIRIEREMLPLRESNVNLSQFVVTIPAHATEEQRAEADYWLNEMSGVFRYAENRYA